MIWDNEILYISRKLKLCFENGFIQISTQIYCKQWYVKWNLFRITKCTLLWIHYNKKLSLLKLFSTDFFYSKWENIWILPSGIFSRVFRPRLIFTVHGEEESPWEGVRLYNEDMEACVSQHYAPNMGEYVTHGGVHVTPADMAAGGCHPHDGGMGSYLDSLPQGMGVPEYPWMKEKKPIRKPPHPGKEEGGRSVIKKSGRSLY